MSRLTIYIPDEIANAYRQSCDASGLSYSEPIRELVIAEMRNGDMFDSIDPAVLELAEKEAEQEQIMARQKLAEKKASFDDRIQGFFRKRLQGDAAYDPRDMKQLAEGYKADAQNWFDSEQRIERKCDLVDRWMQQYRAGYRARAKAEQSETEMDRTGNWFEIGGDLQTLQDRKLELFEEMQDKIESDGFDPDAILDSMANEFSVNPVAVEMVISSVAPEVSQHEFLVGGSEADSEKALSAVENTVANLEVAQ